ncbi:MAG: VanW family protein [Clostridia bacterium]|nr:VanW family protein [Clostridia bacterium]
MKKALIVLTVIIGLIGGGIWWYNSTKTEEIPQAKNDTSNYQSERSYTNINYETTVTKQEVEIASFSTNIYNKDEERQNNITITCQTLSTKEIQPGETFSFCDTVGKATHTKGYEEADIYVDGKKEQGLGGGMCQVSTTLYNAVLQVPELEVVERHEHSGHVPYIQSGNDAAIAYGTYDFKFKNNTNNVIKIVMENTPDNITAKLLKIQEVKSEKGTRS